MSPLPKDYRGRKIGLDSMIFIYAFEEHPSFLSILKAFFLSLEKGEMEAVISTLTIMECLAQPYRKKNFGLAGHYMALFRNFPHLSVIPVTDDVAERAAFLRARYNLKTPDAIHLATSLVAGCDLFLTNDDDLPSVDELQIEILDRLVG